MSKIGIPTWVFQVQPRNSEAREPTSIDLVSKFAIIYNELKKRKIEFSIM